MKYLIVIGGATASGKTDWAIRIARRYHTAILSADSRQFYRGMDIGTAKPGPEDLRAAPHYFIDSREVWEDYSVGDFERDALQVLEQLFQNRDCAVLAGGSGLYLNAVCSGLDDFPEISADTRRWVVEGEETGGLAWLQAQLAALDPAYFERVDRQNLARLRRALEVCRQSGRAFSSFLQGGKKERPFQCIYLLLELPRPELYARIEARVDAMVAAGLEDEARRLLPYRHRPALRTVGYEEWFDFFDGKMSRAETIDKIKQHTRNYAKRQATWFRKHGEWQTFHPNDATCIFAFLDKMLTPPGGP